jgi:hypothetical protein
MNENTAILRNSVLTGVSILLVTILVFLFSPSMMVIKVVSDIFPLVLSAACAAIAYRIFRRQERTRLGSRIWGAMTLGLGLWVCGEVIWSYYELVLQQDTPFPSLADVLWMLGYIPLIYAVASQYLPLRAAMGRRQRVLIVVTVAVALALTFWLVVLPILNDPEAGTPVEMFFNLMYPIGDMLLLAFAAALATAFLGGELGMAWGPIAAGIILLSISDLLFSYGIWNDLYYPDGELNFLSGLFDVLYISAYVVWAIGLYRRLQLPEVGSELYSKSRLPEDQARLVDADLTKWIINKAEEQEREQRISAAENPLRVYVNAVIGLLDHLIRHAGGGGVENAFDTFLNEKALQTGCDFEIHKGDMTWKGEPSGPDCYTQLLDEAIRYAKSVVATKTIDRNLQNLERHLPSRIVQAAEENRLRMVRWLDEKPR